MNTRTWREVPDSRKSVHALARALALVVTCGMLCSALSLAAQEKPDKDSASGKGSQGAGIYFDAEASAKDVGLPIYPGARPHRDKDENQSSGKFGLWGNSFAFKLAVVAGFQRFTAKSRHLLQEGFGKIRDGTGLWCLLFRSRGQKREPILEPAQLRNG